MSYFIGDYRKIGFGLTAFGLLFMFLGVLLLFDKGLLAMGNVLFLSGIALVIGVRKTMRFFFRKSHIRGTACFLGGILGVLIGRPHIIICMAIEIFGFFNLFGDFFPQVLLVLENTPFVGSFLSLPVVSTIAAKMFGRSARLPV